MGGERVQRGSVVPRGAHGGAVPLWGNLCWLLLPLLRPFSFLFLWWLVWCKRLTASDLAPYGLGSEVQGPFLPLAVKEHIHWRQDTAIQKRRLQLTSKTGSFLPVQDGRRESHHPASLAKVQVYIVQSTWFPFGEAGVDGKWAERAGGE